MMNKSIKISILLLIQLTLKFINATTLIECTDGCENLQNVTVNCEFKRFAYLSTEHLYICFVTNENAFTGTRANVIAVEGNHIYEPNNDDVTGIYIGSNWQLQYFPRNFDKFFKNIISIEIEDGDLRELKREDLQPFPNLKYLYLGNNRLTKIVAGTFDYNPELEILYLSNNRISYIDPQALNGLNNLRRLFLDSNDCREDFGVYTTRAEVTGAIERIQKGECSEKEILIDCKFEIFQWFATRKLYICRVTSKNVFDGSRVRVFYANGQHLSDKENEDISGFYISGIPNVKYFPRGFDKVFRNIKVIEIEYSSLKVITQRDLKPFAQLKYLYLEGNHLKSIGANLFKFNPHLEILWLKKNEINYIDPTVLSGFKNQIFRLFLSDNDCRRVFDDVKNSKVQVIELIERIERGECTPNNINRTNMTEGVCKCD